MLKFHKFDPVSFVAAVVALVLGIAALRGDSLTDQLEWIGPLLLGVAGIVVIGAAIDHSRRVRH